MAPRKPKPDDDATSTTSTEHAVLKPNTTKAKIEKPKSDKPKVVKPKVVKKEKVVPASPASVVGVEGGSGEGDEKKEKVVKSKVVKKDGASGGSGGGEEKEGKEKVKPVVGEEAVQLMVEYLKGQNRPYSATEVSANLHGKVTKTNADKLLKEMEQNGLIMGKATKKDGGGQWVFWPLQDPSDNASPTDLANMDTQITNLRESNPTLKTNLKHLSTKLTTIKSAPLTSELSSLVAQLQSSIKEKIDQLEAFKSKNVKTVTKEELEMVERDWKYWGLKRKARMKAFRNLEGDLLEGYKKDELWEKAGLEEDVM